MTNPDRLFAAVLTGVLTVLLSITGCDYARMTTDESHDTYEAEMPVMPAGSIATAGNSEAYRLLGPAALHNPAPSSPAVLARGRRAYTFFCAQCHAPGGTGRGTVGQSFAPLPADLTADAVQRQNDGELYYKITYGFRRHPDLSHTMLEDDIWAVIHHLRRMPPTIGSR